jgi:hypothetical protein
MERGTERRADGGTDIEMQTVTFATLQTLVNMKIFQFLINHA